jgi:hypothetical protein
MVLRGDSGEGFGQGTYQLSHPERGAISVFLVPIADDGTNRDYEAVFTTRAGE